MAARQNKLEEQIRSVHSALANAGKGDQPVSLFAEDFDFLVAKNSITLIDSSHGTFNMIKVKRWERKESPKIK